MATLRHVREQLGYSQQELADASGVSQHTISEIELGRRKPQGRTLRKLARALSVEVANLRGGPDSPLAKAPPSLTQPPLNGFEEGERRESAYDVALDAARRQAIQDRQAAARALESERPQTYFMRHENEAVMELSKYPPDELAGALMEATAAQEDQRRASILAKAIGVAAERWAAITSDDASDREAVFGVYLVAADLKNLLDVVTGDSEVWEKLSRSERSEIVDTMAALGRITGGYRARRNEEHAAEERKAMVRQWTREIARSA